MDNYRTRVDDGETQVNEVSGVKIDPEKGRDISVVSWYSDNDPEVRYLHTFPSEIYLRVF